MMKNEKVSIEIPLIARLRVSCIKDIAICRKLGISRSGLRRILKLQAYREEEARVLKETLAKMDAVLTERAEIMRSHLPGPLPEATRRIVEAALRQREERLAKVETPETKQGD